MLFSTAIKRKETNTPGVCRVSGCTRVRGAWLQSERLHTCAGRVAAGGGARALHLSHAAVNTALGSCHTISHTVPETRREWHTASGPGSTRTSASQVRRPRVTLQNR